MQDGHHIWCNGSRRDPVKGCCWCDPDGDGKTGLWALYPYDTDSDASALAKKHFPDVIERK